MKPLRLLIAPLRYPFSLAAGAVLAGVFIMPVGVSIYEAAMRSYDESYPVVEMNGTLIRATSDEIVVSIGGTKNRECHYLRLQAYTVDQAGALHDANITRVDLAERGDTKPVGRYMIGTWKIWPRGQALRTIVYTNHLCGSRVVVTKIAEVTL